MKIRAWATATEIDVAKALQSGELNLTEVIIELIDACADDDDVDDVCQSERPGDPGAVLAGALRAFAACQ